MSMKGSLLRTFACGFGLFLLASHASAADKQKKMMHCFAFTPIKEATDADWMAFY